MSTASDHTITCKIKGITHQATVEWTTGTALISTGSEYAIDEGTIRKNNEQHATLKIAAATLEKLGDTAHFTCKVSSGVSSKSVDVTLTILKLGKILKDSSNW